MAGNSIRKKAADRTSLDSAATAETVDTSDDESSQHGSPPSAHSAVAVRGSSDGVTGNSNGRDGAHRDLVRVPHDELPEAHVPAAGASPPRRTSRKRKLKRPDFKGCQGVGTSEPKYKLGVNGGGYRGKSAMKRAPKSAR